MKKFFGIVLFFLVLLMAAGCATKPVLSDSQVASTAMMQPTSVPTPEPTPEPDFRNVRWGMSINEVKTNESIASVEESVSQLLYHVSVANLDAALVYTFNEDDSLCEAAYLLQESHVNDNEYVDDFNRLKKALIEKYGKPTKDDERWNGGSHLQSDPDNLGLAIATGYYTTRAEWDTPSTTITLIISGDNFDISTALFYASKSVSLPKSSDSGL